MKSSPSPSPPLSDTVHLSQPAADHAHATAASHNQADVDATSLNWLAQSLNVVHHFAELGPTFSSPVQAQALRAPYVVAVSDEVAHLLGLAWPTENQHTAPSGAQYAALAAVFSGNHCLPSMQPRAAVYSGHQFGMWAGQLGDGRAILLGSCRNKALSDHPLISEMNAEMNAKRPDNSINKLDNNTLWQTSAGLEVQLKGAGPTPYSRMGDGRAVLRSSIREFLCSEAMAGLGIPTTRALCVVGADEAVQRETTETAAVVTRVAPSFIRFGSFEHFYHHHQHEALKQLADYVIDHFYPALKTADQPYLALLQTVSQRTATLMAQWQAVGFCHGVMNTDNMSILGLTLDYGPFGFMETFDPAHICNHSDMYGRYAYQAQPMIGQWNVKCLAQSLVPLIQDIDAIMAVLHRFVDQYETAYLDLFRAKLGLSSSQPGDDQLIADWLSQLQVNQLDFTQSFRRLGTLSSLPLDAWSVDSHSALAQWRDDMIDRAGFDAWIAQYQARLRAEHSVDATRQIAMNRVNPKYILRNYLAEQAIRAAQQNDFTEVNKLLRILRRPYDEQPENETYADLPPDWASQLSVSCSS